MGDGRPRDRVPGTTPRGAAVRRALRGPWGVALLSLAAQAGVVGALGLPLPLRGGATWNWAFEQGAVAQALLDGLGYADVFQQGSGPTAWCGPVYPLLLAGVLHMSQGVNAMAQWCVLLLHAGLVAGVAGRLQVFGRVLGSERRGRLAGVLWALNPQVVYYSITVVWDHVLVAFLLLSVLLELARAGRDARPRELVRPGLWLGLGALVNPALLALLPVLVAFVVRGRPWRAALRNLVAYGAPALAVVLPWSVRNAVQLGSPALKANLGVELYVGNNDAANGTFVLQRHPSFAGEEARLYLELGEVAYGQRCRDRALAWIRAHPGDFARLCLRRARLYWLGFSPFGPVPTPHGGTRERDREGWVEWGCHLATGLLGLLGLLLYRDDRGGALLVRGTLLLFPLVYYATHFTERYRYPLEPLLAYVGAWVLLQVANRGRTGQDAARRR